jgi:hypothetical protein
MAVTMKGAVIWDVIAYKRLQKISENFVMIMSTGPYSSTDYTMLYYTIYLKRKIIM